MLVIHRGSFVPSDVLIEALWPVRPPADPLANLKVLVNRARHTLGDASLILTGPGGYSLVAGDRCRVDAERFGAEVQSGHDHLAAGRARAALGEFRAALASWTGEPLPEDTYEEWAEEYRSRLARTYLEALERGAAAALAAGDPALAADLAQQAVGREPLRESAHLLLARALAASGDTAAALDALSRLRSRFADDLGLDPSPEALTLEGRILRGERFSPATPARSGGFPAPAFEELRFVGREAELETLLRALVADPPGVALLAGPAGAGKSRLLSEAVARSGLPVIAVKAFLPEREEPWTLGRSLLREALAFDAGAAGAVPDHAAQALADVVPELEGLRPIGASAMELQSRRALAMEGAVRMLQEAVSKGAGLLVDDLQWADATSLGLLGRLLRRVGGVGTLLAFRPEEVTREGPRAEFLREVSAAPCFVSRVELGPLPAEAVSRLVADEKLAEVIVNETDSSPFAVAEVIRALASQGAVESNAQGRWCCRTSGADEAAQRAARMGRHRAVRARIDWHGPRATKIMSLLSLLGREAPTRFVADAMGSDPRSILDDLESLAHAGLVRLGNEGWAVAHDLIAEAAVQDLEPASRGGMHEMIARSLRSGGGEPSELARHLAGAGDAGAAAEAFAQAAHLSLDRFATDEAERLAEESLRLQPRGPLRSDMLETRAEARARRGDLAGAREDLRAALAGRGSGPGRSRALTRLATLTSGAEDFSRAEELVEVALVEAGGDPAARANALAVGAFLDLNTNRFDRAEVRCAEALGLFERSGNGRGMAEILEARAAAAFLQGRLLEAAPLLERCARLFSDAGDLLRVSTPRSARGLVLTWMGRPEDGLSEIDDALEIARILGNPELQAWCLWMRGEPLMSFGRVEEARQNCESALAIARKLGHREYTAAALAELGTALRAGGDLPGAEALLRESLQTAEGIPIFSAFAASRLAAVLLDRGDFDDAEHHAQQAIAEGPPITHFEARLTLARIAAARGDQNARGVAAEALSLAEAAGHLASAAGLRELVASLSDAAPGS
jgi:DNA-binding SARP family transcriptional activator/predicted negative regulator of RcsB-dependent stress response